MRIKNALATGVLCLSIHGAANLSEIRRHEPTTSTQIVLALPLRAPEVHRTAIPLNAAAMHLHGCTAATRTSP